MKNIFDNQKISMSALETYHVYVQTDERSRILAVNSSAFVPAEWGTEIDQGWGDK